MQNIVYVIDEDNYDRNCVADLLESSGYFVMRFSSAETFLKQDFTDLPSCVILETTFRRLSGIDICDTMRDTAPEMPLIFLTSMNDIPTAVRAIKKGAYDFLTKPFNEEALLECIKAALKLAALNMDNMKKIQSFKDRYMSLTSREFQVLQLVINGNLNKQIAFRLGISEVTVKVHRRRIMFKMQARSVAELARDVERLGSKCTLFNGSNLHELDDFLFTHNQN